MSQQKLTAHRKSLKAIQGKLNQAIRFDKELDVELLWEQAEAILATMATDGCLDWVYAYNENYKGDSGGLIKVDGGWSVAPSSASEYLIRRELYDVVYNVYWNEINPRCVEYITNKVMN